MKEGVLLYAAAARLDEPDYTHDVAAWVHRRLDMDLWGKQREITEMLHHPEKHRVAVRSAHSTGKTLLAACICCHHIDTRHVGEARAITTAPSQTQVKSALWGEINKLFGRAEQLAKDRSLGVLPLPGRVTQTEWWIGRWQAGIGRKPNEYRPELFAGLHCREPLIVLDEADGLPRALWDGVEALMTSRLARMLAIGNPLDPGSRFSEITEEDVEWLVLKIAAQDTPNFTGEEGPAIWRDVLLDPAWVEARRLEWGGVRAKEDPTFQPDHPFWYGRVLAQYPPQAAASIMRWADLEACRDQVEVTVPAGVRQAGLDVAGSEKGDLTVMRERVGQHLLRRASIQTGDDDAVVAFAVETARVWQTQVIVTDATGMGHYFTKHLRDALPNVAVLPINFGAAATELNPDGSKKYVNLRAQLWWHGRDLSQDRAWDLSLAEDYDQLGFELMAARYRPDVLAGRKLIQVEDKAAIRSRIGRSPDDADAALMAFHSARGGGSMRLVRRSSAMLARGAELVKPR